MKLKSLIQRLNIQMKGKDVFITGLSSDSRTIFPGNLFIAKKGANFNGVDWIDQAIHSGAAAILTDLYDPFCPVSQLIHPNPSEVEAKLAARYYKHPSKELFTVGVTGTKGKTTTSYIVKHLLDLAGIACGLIGTIETIIGEKKIPSSLTTQDALINQKRLKEMVSSGCRAAVLEVSSHGLIQKRVDEIEFDLGIFTNLYPDHLDYHKTIEEYAKAKRLLFERAKKGVLSIKSPFYSFMKEACRDALSFGIEKGDISAFDVKTSLKGSSFRIENVLFQVPLIGAFNVENALAAIAACLEKGLSLEFMSKALKTLPPIAARLERIGNVFIDFAHTKEALENLLLALKSITQGKIILVFGCGGDRDPQRRSGMGKVADTLADIAIITNDNPRSEDPIKIAEEIASCFSKPPLIVLDRKEAIFQAIQMRKEEDLVLIAGKGHEKVQIFAHQTVAFSDREVVEEALSTIYTEINSKLGF